MQEDRKLHIDLLRIVACISVIMLHSASQYWYEFPVTDTRWMVYNVWDAISRFGVPVFVMISGMLFLSREGEPDLRKLYCNNILRLAVAYAVWSMAYGLWDSRGWTWGAGVTVRDYVAECVLGRYHLWFIPMLIGIYMLLPVIKTFTDHCSKKNLEYFLILFIILQIGRSTLGIIQIPTLANVLVQLLDVEMACSYVGYFVLGYYLHRYRLSHVWQVRVYFLGAVSLILAAIISLRASMYYQTPKSEAFDSYSVFTFIVTVAVFVFFQEKISNISWKGLAKKLLA
ncbi:MAG: acyltransferase family protein, partial [Lachnospiraceae bacterium]|nr:acyltransferase family protein [Lachnospiraceae bacterium]